MNERGPTAIRYTKGPWKAFVRPDTQRPGFYLIDCDAGIVRPPPRLPIWEVRGNARLIAAGPEMIEALVAGDALLWKSVPWGKTFDLDVRALNEVPLQVKRAILRARMGDDEKEAACS